MKKKLLNILKYVLAFALTGFLVYLALRGMDWKIFVEGLKDTKWIYVILSLGFALLALILRSERWHDLMVPVNPEIRRIDLWNACSIGNLVSVGVPWISFLVRCGAVTDKRTPYDKTLGTFIMERAWDMLMVFVLTIFAIALNTGDIARWFIDNIAMKFAGRLNITLIGIAAALVAGVTLFIIAVFKMKHKSAIAARIADWLTGIWEGLKSFGQMKHKIRFIFYTAGIWISYVMMSFCVFKAIPVLHHLNFADALFVSIVGNLSSLLPVPGGFGAYHYFVALALSSLYGATWETGILFATLTHETRSLMLVALGAISMMSAQKRKIVIRQD